MGCATSKIESPTYIPPQTSFGTNMQQIIITPQNNYSLSVPTAPVIEQINSQQTYPQQSYNQSQYYTPYVYQQQMYPQQIFPQYYYPQKTSVSI